MIRFLSILTVMLTLLTGCETMKPQRSQGQLEQERISKQVAAAFANGKPCVDAIKEKAEIKRLHDELLFDTENSPNKFTLMTKNEMPTDEQIELLKSTVPIATQCRQIVINGLNGTPFQVVMLKNFNALDALYLKMMKREISIGTANEEKNKILIEHKTNWAQASSELDSRLRAMHNSEMEGNRQAAAAMMPYLLQQQQNNQMQQQLFYQQQMQNINNNRPILTAPTTTNCMRYGNQIDCTTR
jgi:hypothetical protein